MEEPIALYIAVYQVPKDRQPHDNQGHFAFSFHYEWEDERALEIVGFEDQEKNPIGCISCNSSIEMYGTEIEKKHDNKHGCFHKTPAYLIIDGGSPFFGAHLAITGIDKIECDKNDQPHQSHNKKQVVEELKGVDMFHSVCI